MKRIIPIFLILTLLLAGCGSTSSSTKTPDDKAIVSENANTDNENVTADASANESDTDTPEQSSGIDLPEIDVDITEKMYVTYINEIYVNTDDYLGETIRIQGMFQSYTDDTDGQTYYYVFRTGPGCCGNDGSMCGFEFTWDGDIPNDNDWIEVVGSLRTYDDEDGWTYLTLDAKSVTVMNERGAETVYQ